ncbi:hypothetical protein SLEP1_g37005 [Rubroshorea leprosula]|uniref:Reverse transcriptase Ty1/copia-type domain-containing protein n=1 Tax=Rubroshorea leprosula TaxID=152421 RepID=A0AAV5KTD7_9ROSI|nr:hypothetical protein SLEP1_g37005 [Rubroshorea leprosula]
MQEELDTLQKNETWKLVPPPLSSTNIVGFRWVFKTKLHPDGSIERFKACLEAKGFSQIPRVDFNETFSPVLKPTTLRLVIALATNLNWPLRQLDVKNAFLHGKLKETVYMTQLPGTVLLQLYVDDIVLTASSKLLLQSIINHLSREFALKDLGQLSYFLGMEVTSFDGGTQHYELPFYSYKTLSLTRFYDADWAACVTTRRSTTGYYIFLGANCMSWSSKKQPTVARSTAEAKYHALAFATAKIVWITYILRDIGISLPSPPQLFSNNISALHMFINPVFHA